MNDRFLQAAATALGILVFATAGSAYASHCDLCSPPIPTSVALAGETVALDGVLALVVLDAFSTGDLEPALPYITISVRDDADAPVAGALESSPGFFTPIWRPSQPWVAGATYQVDIVIDTDRMRYELYPVEYKPGACKLLPEYHGAIVIDAEPLPPPAAPPLTFDTSYTVDRALGIASLVCCDGSYPHYKAAPGALCEWNGDSGTSLQGAERCTSRQGYGRLSVQQAVDAAQLAPTVAANLTVRMLVDDQPSFPQSSALSVARDLYGPACLRFETLDLARGDIFVDERCVGDDIADQLGKIDVDPFANSEWECQGAPYVCEVINDGYGGRWDENACWSWPDGTPLPGEAPTTTDTSAPDSSGEDSSGQDNSGSLESDGVAGCACDSSGGGPASAGLALLFAAWLFRSRMSRMSGAPSPRPGITQHV